MNPSLLLEMVAGAVPDRRAVGAMTYGELDARATAVAAGLRETGATHVAFVDEYSDTVPVLFYAAQRARVPFVPLNYRLSDDGLRSALARIAPAVVVAGEGQRGRCAGIEGITLLDTPPAATGDDTVAAPAQPDDGTAVSVLLFTSGTSGDPKIAVLRPEHLTSYVLSTVDFLSAGEDETQLVAVPPYHIAGVSTVLTSLFAGRRIVVLPSFTPQAWVDKVVAESVTHAMVVPTMLGRILDVLEEQGAGLPLLRHLSYGGGRMPGPVVERALRLLPHVDLVNAYGLTETSSTIAVLGPADHRAAVDSPDPAVRARLGSVGRPLPGVEVEVRSADGRPAEPGEVGEVHVRGEQVSGEYLSHDATGADGWFPTRDRGHLDADGYLFLDGRADDVIVRGGENLSPGEIEDVLLTHPQVADAMVLGVPDAEWGEVPVAAVVPVGEVPADFDLQLREYVRTRLRSAKTPARVILRGSLPHTDTGKALRRVLRAELDTRVEQMCD
ncbi:class I adenylate-forming enzyme family protein [Pseudonocardia alni]|uniref:Acyl-CoA synthetase (AMP-forming)/AMP-acid ligase II n=1 Tax=Pseudonocardia alni TaxID=33907 RepID=A0A852W8E0_PSEA5|nr:class I adenylate-forming enzyme family protein [Pseudonocardia antarctica]NYG05243.1 acyl-CoA synthetase (AMP-forming)/AMP-acid ligase II [Pseudonocardia antarctica]